MNYHINPTTGKQPCTTTYKAGGNTTVRRLKAMMEEGQLFCYLLLLLAVTGAAPVSAQPQPIALNFGTTFGK